MINASNLPDRVEESELPAVLGLVLSRSEEGGVTVITRDGKPIAAVMSMADYEVAEEEVDRRFAERERPADDGPPISLDDLLADHAEEGRGQ